MAVVYSVSFPHSKMELVIICHKMVKKFNFMKEVFNFKKKSLKFISSVSLVSGVYHHV